MLHAWDSEPPGVGTLREKASYISGRNVALDHITVDQGRVAGRKRWRDALACPKWSDVWQFMRNDIEAVVAQVKHPIATAVTFGALIDVYPRGSKDTLGRPIAAIAAIERNDLRFIFSFLIGRLSMVF